MKFYTVQGLGRHVVTIPRAPRGVYWIDRCDLFSWKERSDQKNYFATDALNAQKLKGRHLS